VTSGNLSDRDYLNYFTGISILTEAFEILDSHNWTMHEKQFKTREKIARYLLRFCTPVQTRYLIYLMGKSRREDCFQTLFRCRVKTTNRGDVVEH
jgi:hypothetical protein